MEPTSDFLYTKDDVARIAENLYLWRMKLGKEGNADKDWVEAEKLCEKWWGNATINT